MKASRRTGGQLFYRHCPGGFHGGDPRSEVVWVKWSLRESIRPIKPENVFASKPSHLVAQVDLAE